MHGTCCRSEGIKCRGHDNEAVGGYFTHIGDMHVVYHLWGESFISQCLVTQKSHGSFSKTVVAMKTTYNYIIQSPISSVLFSYVLYCMHSLQGLRAAALGARTDLVPPGVGRQRGEVGTACAAPALADPRPNVLLAAPVDCLDARNMLCLLQTQLQYELAFDKQLFNSLTSICIELK